MNYRGENHYCSRCLRTRRFYDTGDALICERCRKTLEKRRGIRD